MPVFSFVYTSEQLINLILGKNKKLQSNVIADYEIIEWASQFLYLLFFVINLKNLFGLTSISKNDKKEVFFIIIILIKTMEKIRVD